MKKPLTTTEDVISEVLNTRIENVLGCQSDDCMSCDGGGAHGGVYLNLYDEDEELLFCPCRCHRMTIAELKRLLPHNFMRSVPSKNRYLREQGGSLCQK